VTKDGAQVKLEANIGRPEEVEIALKFGAEGSGFLNGISFHGPKHVAVRKRRSQL